MKKIEPVMMPSGVSPNFGYLELENDVLRYIKRKGQAQGRVNIFVWLVIKLSRSVRNDKILFELNLKDVKNVELTEGNSFAKYGKLIIEHKTGNYSIQFESNVKDQIDELYDYIRNLIGSE